MNNLEKNFLRQYNNSNISYPTNEFLRNKEIILKDNNSSIIFTVDGLFLKYKIKTLDKVFKKRGIFGGGDYIYTPHYKEYFLSISYDTNFKHKLEILMRVKKHYDDMDKSNPDSKRIVNIGGHGIGEIGAKNLYRTF